MILIIVVESSKWFQVYEGIYMIIVERSLASEILTKQ